METSAAVASHPTTNDVIRCQATTCLTSANDELDRMSSTPNIDEKPFHNSSVGTSGGSVAAVTAGTAGRRTVFTRDQLEAMEERFIRQSFLTREERIDLGEQLNLTERQIMIWFQNRRGRLKKKGCADKAYGLKQIYDGTGPDARGRSFLVGITMSESIQQQQQQQQQQRAAADKQCRRCENSHNDGDFTPHSMTSSCRPAPNCKTELERACIAAENYGQVWTETREKENAENAEEWEPRMVFWDAAARPTLYVNSNQTVAVRSAAESSFSAERLREYFSGSGDGGGRGGYATCTDEYGTRCGYAVGSCCSRDAVERSVQSAWQRPSTCGQQSTTASGGFDLATVAGDDESFCVTRRDSQQWLRLANGFEPPHGSQQQQQQRWADGFNYTQPVVSCKQQQRQQLLTGSSIQRQRQYWEVAAAAAASDVRLKATPCGENSNYKHDQQQQQQQRVLTVLTDSCSEDTQPICRSLITSPDEPTYVTFSDLLAPPLSTATDTFPLPPSLPAAANCDGASPSGFSTRINLDTDSSLARDLFIPEMEMSITALTNDPRVIPNIRNDVILRFPDGFYGNDYATVSHRSYLL